MVKNPIYYNDFERLLEEIQTAITSKDVPRILSWFHHCFDYFPPILYEYGPILMNSLKNDECFIYIMRRLYNFCPDLVYTYSLQRASFHNGVYGVPVTINDPHETDKVLIYSSKFTERYKSFQEAYKPLVEAICAKYNVLLVSPSSRPASPYYQSLSQYLEIPDDSALDFPKSIKKLNSHNPRVFMEMTPMEPSIATKMDRTFTATMSGQPMDQNLSGSRRSPDFLIEDPAQLRKKIPVRQNQTSVEAWTYNMPRSNAKRNYLIDHNKTPNGKEIRFGAFCRLAKVDLMTLNNWANALRYFPSAKLYFAFMRPKDDQKLTEHYTKKYFESLSIDPSRIIFFPVLSTNDYLFELSKMDIVFGANPEQGGVSGSDALALGVPYLVTEINSITTTASILLKLIGKPEWSVNSCSEFICAIEKILINLNATNNFFTRSKLRQDVIFHMDQQRVNFHNAIFKMLDQAIC